MEAASRLLPCPRNVKQHHDLSNTALLDLDLFVEAGYQKASPSRAREARIFIIRLPCQSIWRQRNLTGVTGGQS
jgi:hypothetical protein